MPSWAITDNLCQLCHKEIGTISHRFDCDETRPPEGWPAPPKEANLLINRLSSERLQLLKERGLLVLRLPAPPPQQDGSFIWKIDPTASEKAHGATWYFDGSLLHGKWKDYRTTGFSICVVAQDASLIGFGHGTPPHWCLTAAAAEAWALFVVVSATPFAPNMRTDCLSLLRTAEQGTKKATGARRALARVWKLIASNLDGYISTLAIDNCLTWMPAHQSRGMVGEATLSNGARLTNVDRRANRLVDAGAKLEAALRKMPPAVDRILESARHAVTFFVKLLGMVTFAANNHTRIVCDEHGSEVVRTFRDSTPKPVSPKKSGPANAPAHAATKKGVQLTVKAWTEPPAPRKKSALSLHAQRVMEYEHACTARRVDEIGSSLCSNDTAKSASVRMSELALRVRGRTGP